MRRLDALTLKQLRAMQAVCDHGTISAAADILSLTPPAVHNQLKTLEDNFGCALVTRSAADGFRPTEEGEALLSGFRRTQAALEHAIFQIDSLRRGQSGRVVLGMVSTAKYFAPGLVSRMRRDLPDIDVVLREGNRQRIIAGLNSGELDLVIMGRPPRVPPVTAHVLGEHPHFLIAPPDHRLVGAGPAAPEDVLQEHFVMRESGSGTRILCTRYLDELGAGREVAYTEMESNETIKQAVISGLGIAMLSGHTVHEELRSGRLATIPAPGLPIVRQWFVLFATGEPPTKASRAVLDWIGAHGGELLPDLG